ncbi:MAG: (2Fe-2S)-binding protein [Mycobacterium sp.]
MFVCLCNGVTSNVVTDAIERGAASTGQVAEACGAGADCGRCRHTVRAIIRAMNAWPGGGAEAGPGCRIGPSG